MAFVIDDAIIASILAGVAASSIGAGVNAGMAQQADRKQATITNRQRQQAAETRAMMERRQAWLSQQMNQDEALIRAGEDQLYENMKAMGDQATRKGIEQETTRLSDVLGGDKAQAQTRVGQDISAATMTSPGKDVAQVFADDKASKAQMFGADAARRIQALAANTAYDTFGQKQAIQMGRGADALGLTAALRRGNRAAYDRQMQTLMQGEQAGNAATNALGDQYIPLDTRLGDVISGVGNIALSYGAGKLGQRNAGKATIFG